MKKIQKTMINTIHQFSKRTNLLIVLFVVLVSNNSSAQYCTPSGAFSACAFGLNDFWITDASFTGTGSTFNYTGGACVSTAPYYLNTNYQADVVEGNIYTLSISRAGNSYDTYFNVWVDWDNNNTLNNATPFVENIAANLFLSAGGGLTSTATITIPAGVSAGIHRMRIRVQYNATNPNNPCLTTGQAETKDFNLNVLPNCVPPNVTANASDTSICFGSSVTLNGGGAINYNWNNGVTDGIAFSPLNTNNYTVIGADANGCTNTASVTITVTSLPLFIVSPSLEIICYGDSAFTTANSIYSLSYTWNPGNITDSVAEFIPTVSTTYTCIATDSNGCTSSNQFSVTVLPLPAVPVISQTGGILQCNSASAVDYQWNLNEQVITGATNSTYNAGTQTGNYTVIISDSSGCSVESLPFTYLGDGISKVNISGINIFPNPFTNFILIENLIGEKEIEIEWLNVTGAVVFKKIVSSKNEWINTSSLPSGFYLLKVKAEKEIVNRVLVKN